MSFQVNSTNSPPPADTQPLLGPKSQGNPRKPRIRFALDPVQSEWKLSSPPLLDASKYSHSSSSTSSSESSSSPPYSSASTSSSSVNRSGANGIYDSNVDLEGQSQRSEGRELCANICTALFMTTIFITFLFGLIWCVTTVGTFIFGAAGTAHGGRKSGEWLDGFNEGLSRGIEMAQEKIKSLGSAPTQAS